ncbi:MAG: cation:proton antiporter [Candidatus Methanoplasma sp.]|nr:cation:proton antiporter [Candidatus Methanoplasma sp.]
MEEQIFLINMTMLLLVGGICSVVFKRIKMPPIIGYLVTGIILANYWGSEDASTEEIVDILADIGWVLLMFCIGMELNLKKLRRSGAFAIMVVLIQLPLMVLGGYAFGLFMGWGAVESIFFGAIISGSSTAVVTAVLKDQSRISKEDVETIILITVVEDVAQVLILSMASPLLVGGSMEIQSIVWMLVMILVFMIASVSIGLLFVPRALDWIASKMPDEILLMTSLGMCFAMALMSVMINMSMAIGAFLMGVVVSQANSRTAIEHDVTPMKDIFMAMFFISVGLQIAPSGVIDNILLILEIFVVYAVLKAGSVVVAYYVGNKSMRLSFMSSVSLVAMGEFAFIIAKEAMDAGIVSESFYTSVIGAALVSMVMLPLLSNNSGKICDVVSKKAPKPLISAFGKMENMRGNYYQKMALSSKNTMSKMKTRAVLVYADLLLLFGLELVFIFFGGDITEFLYDSLIWLSRTDCYVLVLAVNFAALAIPLYNLVKNVKFLEKIVIDVERRAQKSGEGDLQRPSIRFYKKFIKINNWAIVFIIDFLILSIVPNSLGFWEHIVALVAGVSMIIALYLYRLFKP